MKNDNIIKFEVTAAPGSILEKMLQKFLEDRTERRKQYAENFLRRKEKQLKKLTAGYSYFQNDNAFEFYTKFGASYLVTFTK